MHSPNPFWPQILDRIERNPDDNEYIADAIDAARAAPALTRRQRDEHVDSVLDAKTHGRQRRGGR